MKLLLKLSVMTLSILLVSCGSTVVERCNVRIIDNKCRCHQYQVERKDPRRISESIDYPLEYCDNHVSLSPDDWGELLKILMDVSKKDERAKAQSLIREFSEFSKGRDFPEVVEEIHFP